MTIQPDEIKIIILLLLFVYGKFVSLCKLIVDCALFDCAKVVHNHFFLN
jgi:hypothetical protein